MSKSPETLRQEAAAHDQEAADSFDRCDTDGFLSQWANGLTAQQKRMEANLIEAGGVAEFAALYDLEGNRVRAKLIDGKFGLCWAFCDEADRFTGTFISAFPRRESTMERKGYREGREMVPAYVALRGNNAVNVRPVHVRKDKGYPPEAIVVR